MSTETTIGRLIERGVIGLDTLVLGTLAKTDDGAVIGDGGRVYLVADNWRDGKHIYSVTAHVDLGEPDRQERFAEACNATTLMVRLQSEADAAKREQKP